MSTPPVPYYERDGITIYHADCRDVLPGLAADCIVTDPPYGLGKRWTGGTWFTRGAYEGESLKWDSEMPVDVVVGLIERGVPTIIWGGNLYPLPPQRGWLVWSKPNAVPTMADCEFAWTNLDFPAKAFSHPCNGWVRQHPTEKPLRLMRWCLARTTGSVLDPFMGSGTTLRAALDLGRRAIGIEIDERYCEIAARRLDQMVLPMEATS